MTPHYHDDDDPLRVMKAHHENALQVLLDGGTQEAAAEAAGVSRETVNRWLNGAMPAFAAALNRARRERREALADRTTNLMAAAMDAVEDAVKGGDAGLALSVLQMNARYLTPPPAGPESADEFIRAEVDERAHQVDLDLHEIREVVLRKRIGQLSPDRVGIRTTIENEMRAELGEPPHPEDIPYDGPHWSEGDIIPCSRVVAAETKNEALTLARSGFGQAMDPDRVVDVSPLSSVCLSLFAEIVDPQRGLLRDWEAIDTGDDHFDLERLDQHFQVELARLDEQALAAAAHEWSTSHDLYYDLTWEECVDLAHSLRRIAKAAGARLHLYLATDECRYADAPEDPPADLTDDELGGNPTNPDTPPAEHGDPTAA